MGTSYKRVASLLLLLHITIGQQQLRSKSSQRTQTLQTQYRTMVRLTALCILLICIASGLSARPTAEESSERLGDGSLNNRNSLLLLQRLFVKPTDDNSESLKSPNRKRTCYFNAGLSHSCDYRDLVRALDEANYWSSELTPGRRRKRQPLTARPTPTVTASAI